MITYQMPQGVEHDGGNERWHAEFLVITYQMPQGVEHEAMRTIPRASKS